MVTICMNSSLVMFEKNAAYATDVWSWPIPANKCTLPAENYLYNIHLGLNTNQINPQDFKSRGHANYEGDLPAVCIIYPVLL